MPTISRSNPAKPRKVARYGWKPDLPDHRDKMFSAVFHNPSAQIPPKVDLRPGLPPCYDQGQLGSCTGNGCGFVWQFALAKEGVKIKMPARLFIYYWERAIEHTINSDAGAEIRDGLKVLNTHGCCEEALWPYNIQKFTVIPSKTACNAAIRHEATQYARLDNNLAHLKQCLAQGFPVVFGFTVYDSFEGEEVAKTGVLNMPGPNESVQGGHCVALVGYDDESQRFIVRNSWGTGWGMAGYFTIPFEYISNPNLASDFWTVRLVS